MAATDIELRLAALETRVFGYVPGAFDILALRSGKDLQYIQAAVLVTETAAETGGAKGAAEMLRMLLQPQRIITTSELSRIIISAEVAPGQEIALCEFSDAHGLVWRGMPG